jgi:hypothetical protein
MRRFTPALLCLVVGVEIGILVDHFLLWRKPAPSPVPAGVAVAAAVGTATSPVRPSVAVDASASFNDNLYPSLLLSLGSAYPEYARCLTVVVSNVPEGRNCQVRVESSLFVQPFLHEAPVAEGGRVELNPDLPWNYAALRRVGQLRPESFVISVSVDNRPAAQTTIACMVHPVNEVVSRVFDATTGGWQDTSVCFAAFVNEDSPLINALLQEVQARGAVPRLGGYDLGQQGVLQELQAVWDALAAKGLRYVDLATLSGGVSGVNTQYVRFLDESLRDQGANCVDASVLMASVFRRIGLRPVLLFKPGHCFVAVYDSAQEGHLIALETTMLSTASFPASLAYASQELGTTLSNLNSPGYSSVDVALARQEGVMPIGD